MQPQIEITPATTRIPRAHEIIAERDREISLLKTTIKGFEAALDLANEKANKAIAPNLDAFKSAVDEAVNPALIEKIEERDRDIEIFKNDVKDLCDRLRTSANQISERNTQIEELQITLKNHREQFDNLKSHFEVTLKAIAMNLNALKGARKPDETKEVDGVMVTFRNYDDNLTHHHKTIIIENVQRAIAEEAKKLKGINLKDFSFDDIPF